MDLTELLALVGIMIHVTREDMHCACVKHTDTLNVIALVERHSDINWLLKMER